MASLSTHIRQKTLHSSTRDYYLSMRLGDNYSGMRLIHTWTTQIRTQPSTVHSYASQKLSNIWFNLFYPFHNYNSTSLTKIECVVFFACICLFWSRVVVVMRWWLCQTIQWVDSAQVTMVGWFRPARWLFPRQRVHFNNFWSDSSATECIGDLVLILVKKRW